LNFGGKAKVKLVMGISQFHKSAKSPRGSPPKYKNFNLLGSYLTPFFGLSKQFLMIPKFTQFLELYPKAGRHWVSSGSKVSPIICLSSLQVSAP